MFLNELVHWDFKRKSNVKKLTLVLSFFSSICFAVNEKVQFNWANDCFTFMKTGTNEGELSDDNYTNGFHLQYSKDDEDYFIGQDIYTPTVLIVDFLVPSDRPYAGFLYGGYANNNYFEDVKLQLPVHTRHKFTVGIVGPSSYAEPVQTSWHKFTKDHEPKGWDHQLNDEPILNYGYLREYDLNWGEKTFKAHPFWEMNAGNELTNLDGGVLIKLGRDIPEMQDRYKKRYWYFFIGANLDFVIRNIFLDGNTFEESHYVEKKPLVFRQLVGFEKKWETFGMRYGLNFASQEFKMQVGDNHQYGGHDYGEVQLFWTF